MRDLGAHSGEGNPGDLETVVGIIDLAPYFVPPLSKPVDPATSLNPTPTGTIFAAGGDIVATSTGFINNSVTVYINAVLAPIVAGVPTPGAGAKYLDLITFEWAITPAPQYFEIGLTQFVTVGNTPPFRNTLDQTGPPGPLGLQVNRNPGGPR